MSKVIVFENGGGVTVLHPAAEEDLPPVAAGQALSWVARKDVPQGVTFWFVDLSSIPEDRTFRQAWELDQAALGDPDGHGDPEGIEKEYQAYVAAVEKELADRMAAIEEERARAKADGEAFYAERNQEEGEQ